MKLIIIAFAAYTSVYINLMHVIFIVNIPHSTYNIRQRKEEEEEEHKKMEERIRTLEYKLQSSFCLLMCITSFGCGKQRGTAHYMFRAYY